MPESNQSFRESNSKCPKVREAYRKSREELIASVPKVFVVDPAVRAAAYEADYQAYLSRRNARPNVIFDDDEEGHEADMWGNKLNAKPVGDEVTKKAGQNQEAKPTPELNVLANNAQMSKSRYGIDANDVVNDGGNSKNPTAAAMSDGDDGKDDGKAAQHRH